jgi:xanthine/CO dehydrogenase XdhC/CoxF family maturation factor
VSDDVLRALLDARERRERCALVTVATTRGSVPREAGAKAIVYEDGRMSGTIGGGKFEALVIADALAALETKQPALKTYPLHEASEQSFGAICGDQPATEFIAQHHWRADEALVIVNRNAGLDREALHAALQTTGWGYLGMMGSRRKVRMVFDELRAAGINDAQLDRVFAPLGLDLGADSPAEIAVSIIAEILRVLRDRSGRSLRDSANPISRP